MIRFESVPFFQFLTTHSKSWVYSVTTVGSSGANIDGIYIASGEAGGHPLDGGGAAGCANTASYTSFKFNLDPADDQSGLRSWGGANSVQLAEVTLYDAQQAWISGATATNPGGNSPGGEPPSAAANGFTDPVRPRATQLPTRL